MLNRHLHHQHPTWNNDGRTRRRRRRSISKKSRVWTSSPQVQETQKNFPGDFRWIFDTSFARFFGKCRQPIPWSKFCGLSPPSQEAPNPSMV